MTITWRECLTCETQVYCTDPDKLVVLCDECQQREHEEYDDDGVMDLRDD